MSIDYNAILSFIISAEIQQRLFWVKIGFFAVSAALLISIIILIFKTHYYQWLYLQDIWEFFTFRPFGAKKIVRIWNNILKRLDNGVESEYKLAIIEADDLMDTSLRRMGYAGKNLEEKLGKLTAATLPNISNVYAAHKLRDNIVHDPDYQLTLDETKTTMDVFQKAFDSLQILA